MSRRVGNPCDSHNRHNRTSVAAENAAHEAVEGGESAWRIEPHAPWLPWATALLAAGCGVYLLAFFGQPQHFAWLSLPLVPDVVIGNWFGGDEPQFAIVDRLPVLLGAGAITAMALLWGWCGQTCLGLARDTGPGVLRRTETVVFSLCLGLPLVSLVTFLVAWMGWLQHSTRVATVLTVVTLLLGIAARRTQRSVRVAHRDWAEGSVPDPATADSVLRRGEGKWVERLLVGWLIAASTVIVLAGMLPPWEFDVLEYHLQAPKEWWQAGQLRYMPHNIYANMPLGAEMPALLAMVFWPGEDAWWWGALVGKTVIAGFAPLTAVLLVIAGWRWGCRTAGLLAAALYLATPWTIHVAAAGLIDGVVGCYVLAAVLASVRGWAAYREDCKGVEGHSDANRAQLSCGYAVLAGWCAGAAAACKYPGLAFAVVPLTMLFAWQCVRNRCAWRSLIAFVLAATAAAGPWYVKNLVATGNPTYPLLDQVWGDATRTVEQRAQWRAAHRQVDTQGRTYSLELAYRAVRQVGWTNDFQNPVVVPLALAVVCVGWRRREVQLIAGLAAFVFGVWWLVGHRIDRFWLPAQPLLALLAGAVTAVPISVGWRNVGWGVAFIGLVFGSLASWSPGRPDNPLGDLRLFVPLQQLRSGGQVPAHRLLDQIVPTGSCALLVGDAQPFDLHCNVLYATCFDRQPLESLLADPGNSRQAFRAARVSHVLVDWNEIGRYRQPGNYGFPEFVTHRLFGDLSEQQSLLRRLESPTPGVDIYEVRASD